MVYMVQVLKLVFAGTIYSYPEVNRYQIVFSRSLLFTINQNT